MSISKTISKLSIVTIFLTSSFFMGCSAGPKEIEAWGKFFESMGTTLEGTANVIEESRREYPY